MMEGHVYLWLYLYSDYVWVIQVDSTDTESFKTGFMKLVEEVRRFPFEVLTDRENEFNFMME